jgi:hypothetical protein
MSSEAARIGYWDFKAPRCECGGFLKAATISFGQRLNQGVLERAGESVLAVTW